MKIFRIIKQFVSDPEYKLCQLALRFMPAESIPDRMWIKYQFHYAFGYPLNLKEPLTYNEKLNWLKLYGKNPMYTELVDKIAVKEWVKKRIGGEYVIPTINSYKSFDEIDFDSLPKQFVLKCNHDSGSVIICEDRDSFKKDKAREILSNALKKNFYKVNREWPYKHVKPMIFAEQYIACNDTKEIADYKFFCFNGKVKALFIATDRQNNEEETKFDFFDEDFNHLAFTNGHPNANICPAKPKCFDLMKTLAERLSNGIPHVRVDFYEVNGHVYFGEMTFFHWGGFMKFEPKEWDKKFGEWLVLPPKTK